MGTLPRGAPLKEVGMNQQSAKDHVPTGLAPGESFAAHSTAGHA